MEFTSMTQADACRGLGITPKTLLGWGRKGCPRNEDKSYDLAAVHKWRLAYERELLLDDANCLDAEAKRKLVKLREERGRLAQIERERLEGRLLTTESVKQALFDLGRESRDAMLNIPDRIADVLAGESDPHKLHTMLTQEIRSAITRLVETVDDEADAEIQKMLNREET